MERHSETRRLKWALAISLGYFFAELIAGFVTNSLALLSDAGHMLSDIGALVVSLFAFRMARRPATPESTYGYHRAEILAALFNGLALWLIVGVIFAAAYNRISNPPEVESFGMIVVAVVGLMVNIAAGFILYESHHHNLNLHGAFMHVVSDAIGSVGAIVAGLMMYFTGWYLADPLISIFIGLLVLYSSWNASSRFFAIFGLKTSTSRMAARISSTSDNGRVKNTVASPREMVRARRRYSSISLPSTKPSSSGAGSQSSFLKA